MTNRTPRYAAEKLAGIRSFGAFCLGNAAPAYPLETFVELSNICDLKCTMCADFSDQSLSRAETIRAKKRGLIDAATILERFDPVLRHALSVHCFGGGEPTIHPEFRPILEHLAGYEVMVDFFTHGQHLDQSLAEFLVANGVHKVTISLSGSTPDIYGRYYLGGDFHIAVSGIRRLAAIKRQVGTPYPIIEINSLGFRPHVETFEDFVELMAEAGANVIHLKQLQRWPHLPHLGDHVSIHRPWVEGRMLVRAIARAKALGVHVDTSQYAALGVQTETEYRERLAEIEREGCAPPVLPRRQPAEDKTPVRCLSGTESKAVVASLFAITPSPAEGFHCLEPFKTMFVTRNGHVRPCCFHNHWSWHLGDITAADPLGIWGGTGYGTMRDAILDGDYPMELCGPCLSKHLGPKTHGMAEQVRAYLAWHRARFGPVLAEDLSRHSPTVLNDLNIGNRAIVARHAGAARAPDDTDLLAGLPAAPMLDHTVATVIEGNLERLGDEVVGWVWSPIEPGRRLPVSVWRGESLVARGTADIMRDDLLAAGKGDGAHGFHVLLPMAEPGLSVTVGGEPARLRFIPPSGSA